MLSKQDWFESFDDMLDSMRDIMRAKNSDYTGASASPFANFTRVEALGITSTEIGFLTRMTDKLCRIATFVNQGDLKVKSESVHDTLIDLANYSLLLAGYIKHKNDSSLGERK